MKRLGVAAALFVLALAPVIAEACPACAGRDRGGLTYSLLLGSMILLPFAAAWIAAKAIRSEEKAERQ